MDLDFNILGLQFLDISFRIPAGFPFRTDRMVVLEMLMMATIF